VDFGIAFYTAHLTQNAVRESARLGVSTKDPFNNAAATAIRTEALARMPAALSAKTVTVNYYANSATVSFCTASVEVIGSGTYTYGLYKVLRLFGGTVPNSTTISRTTQMRYEFQPVYPESVRPACDTISVHAP
jgi:Flp pilus assembly protein TadG